MESKIIKNMYNCSDSGENDHKSILKEISNICFPQLKTLYIYGNGIESIEELSQISMPNLELLSLSINEIMKWEIILAA